MSKLSGGIDFTYILVMQPKKYRNLLIICPPSKINLPLVECIIAEWEAKLMIVQCGVEIWAKVCMYVCKMSCYWAPHVNYAYKPPALDNV